MPCLVFSHRGVTADCYSSRKAKNNAMNIVFPLLIFCPGFVKGWRTWPSPEIGSSYDKTHISGCVPVLLPQIYGWTNALFSLVWCTQAWMNYMCILLQDINNRMVRYSGRKGTGILLNCFKVMLATTSSHAMRVLEIKLWHTRTTKYLADTDRKSQEDDLQQQIDNDR